MEPEPVAERPAWQRTYVIATLAIIGGAIAYGLCDWSGWTRLQHDPYTGAWWWDDGPTHRVAINYYGTILWGLGGAGVGGALGAVATHVYRRPLPPGVITIVAAWALTAVALGGLYYVWTLWPF